MNSSGALKSVRLVLTAAAAALLGGFGLAAPAAAHVSAQPAAVSVYTMSAGRLGASVAALLGLTGVIIGGLALARPTSGIGTGRLGASMALVAGVIGIALGGLVVATSDSGIGTGNGRGGAYVALVVGLIAMVLGGLALARSRRTG
ncbi:DUF6223 family protein [Micromonospora coerulea]|uniref:DUF6223 family protein n=1 Tax=Micromonospora coerulea TaxID=47856 RepID=UPI001904FF50|nr:DUF6223 family protein [Micromonospora veneta]